MVAVRVRVQVRDGSGPGAEGWAAAFADPSDAMRAIGEAMLENVEQRFQTETDPWGAAWAPHSPVTIALRAARGRLGKILQDTRNLANSKYARVIDGGRKVLVGLGASYAHVQHFGNPNNKMFGKAKAPIPARAILP